MRDLLDGCKDLMALEDGKGVLQLVGLVGEECHSMSDFVRVSNVGRGARSTTATGANATCPRNSMRVSRAPSTLAPKALIPSLVRPHRAHSRRTANGASSSSTVSKPGIHRLLLEVLS